MVNVVFVGQEWVATIADAMEEDAQDVETWYHQWRKGYDQGVVRPHDASDWNGGELDTEEAENDAYGEGAGIAHEDFFLFLGFAKDVVDEEWHDDA